MGDYTCVGGETFEDIPDENVDFKSPIDEFLMTTIRNDLRSNKCLAEAAGGGGPVVGVGAIAEADGYFVKTISGGLDDTSSFWKVRHDIIDNLTSKRTAEDIGDYEGLDYEQRIINDEGSGITSFTASNVQSYGYSYTNIEVNDKLRFKIKKGENFFALCFWTDINTSESVTVTVDGVGVDVLGLTDQDGTLVGPTFSAQTASTQYGVLQHFFGLDGEEHIIEVFNSGAQAKEYRILCVDTGFRSEDHGLTHKIKINEGIASINGAEVSYAKSEFTFPEGGEHFNNGYTGYIKIDDAGLLTKEESLSPAWTQVRHGETIDFTSTVTELPVKNHFDFPITGAICMASFTNGRNYFFSYTGKTQTGGPQTQKLVGIVWHKQPQIEYTPQPPWGATYLQGENAGEEKGGDIRITYWAEAPILIDASNNRIDFSITIDGVTSLHAATIAQGYYAADILTVESAVVKAMLAVKPIKGQYICKYSAKSKKWEIGVRGPEITDISFFFLSGINSGASFGPVIGYLTDITGQEVYINPTTFKHLATRVYVDDNQILDAVCPQSKYSYGGRTEHTEMTKAQSRYGFANYKSAVSTGSYGYVAFFPDDNVSGVTVYVGVHDIMSIITYKIDHHDQIYTVNSTQAGDANAQYSAVVQAVFIPIPKGSRKIIVRQEYNRISEREEVPQYLTIFGWKQHYTKPKWEQFDDTDKVLRTYEILPPQLYITDYAFNGGALYLPQIADDQINTITETGAWIGSVAGATANYWTRYTTTAGSTMEIEFVLVGDGGGFAFNTYRDVNASRQVEMYLSDGPINEATDLISRHCLEIHYEYEESPFSIRGLKAGTYTIRLKNVDVDNIWLTSLQVMDRVQPQLNAQVFADLNNNGQGLAQPMHVLRESVEFFAQKKVPFYLSQLVLSNYKKGIVSNVHYGVVNHLKQNFYDGVDVMEYKMYYAGLELQLANEYCGFYHHARTMSVLLGAYTSMCTVTQATFDGQNASGLINCQQWIKGGFHPTSARHATSAQFVKIYQLASTHNAGLTFNMADTRGLRENQRVVLIDNLGVKEEVFVENIVFNASFDIKTALIDIVDVNVAEIDFSGYHSVEITEGDGLNIPMHGFEYTPLPLQHGIIENLLAEKGYFETKTNMQIGVLHGGELFYPTHSDGTIGTWSSSTIQVVGWSLVTGANSIQFIMNGEGLHNVTLLYNGNTASGSVNVKITSRKWVSKES